MLTLLDDTLKESVADSVSSCSEFVINGRIDVRVVISRMSVAGDQVVRFEVSGSCTKRIVKI